MAVIQVSAFVIDLLSRILTFLGDGGMSGTICRHSYDSCSGIARQCRKCLTYSSSDGDDIRRGFMRFHQRVRQIFPLVFGRLTELVNIRRNDDKFHCTLSDEPVPLVIAAQA